MVISRDDVMGLLVEACPSFAESWAALEHEEVYRNDDGTRLHYLDAMELANHLAALHRAGHDDEVRAAFAVVERLHLEGDAYVRELATIGYLEDVQGCFITEPDELARLESMLGPESVRWWRGLLAFWSGRIPLVQALDEPATESREGPPGRTT